MEDAFRSREQALENQFFRAVDQALVERLRVELATEDARDLLREATGITNQQLLDELLECGIDQATLGTRPAAYRSWRLGLSSLHVLGLDVRKDLVQELPGSDAWAGAWLRGITKPRRGQYAGMLRVPSRENNQTIRER